MTYSKKTWTTGETITQDELNNIENGISSVDSKINSLSTVATSGSYNDLTNKPTIPTSLSGLSDVDVTNKTNGYGMVYNSTTGKVALSPLPSGSGSGATSMSGLSDVDVTTTAPAEGNVLTYTSGKWKPETPVSPSSTSVIYEIELSRWGIVQGLPTKPYQTSDYTNANNNMLGINNALSWANGQGYNYVVLPRGNYSVCYPNTIHTQPNMTIDFNFSTLKVMYDSANRSPLDTSSNPVYQFGGAIVRITTANTVVSNLTLIGDRVERSWTDPNEVNVEATTGITVGSGAVFCKITKCNVSYFMGDAIGTGFGPYGSFDFTPPMEAGSLDSSGNPVAAVTNVSLRTKNYTPIPAGLKGFCMIGIGYAPATTIPSGSYNVYFYDSSNNFLWSDTSIRTRDYVSIPKNATQMKLSWEGYLDGTTGTVSLDGNGATQNPPYWAIIVENGIGDHVVVEDCELHRNHRGAMTVGINNMIVQRTYFHDTGMNSASDLDGIPDFPDGTRYGINTEDNSGHNCRFIDNVFVNIRLAIAIRGEYNEITGNEFRFCGFGAYLYSLNFCVVSNNYFYYSTLGSFDYTNFDRHWHVYGNVFKYSSLSWGGTGTVDAVTNNVFYNSTVGTSMLTFNFSGNTFDNSTLNCDTKTIIENNTFNNNSLVNAPTTTIPCENIRRCTFNNGSRINTQSNGGNLLLKDCDFMDAGLKYNDHTTYTLQNCRVNNPTQRLMYSSNMWDIGATHSTLQLINCTVTMGQAALIGSVYWGKLVINGCAMTWNLTSNLTTMLQDSYGGITDGIDITNTTITVTGGTGSQAANSLDPTQNGYLRLDGNIFTNFSITNIGVEIQSSHMTAVPTVGTFTLGQQILNASPTAGGNLGWICITAGTITNKSWAAATDYTTNNLIASGGYIYQPSNAGRSVGTAPTFPTALNATIQDNVGLATSTWQPNTPYTASVGTRIIPTAGNATHYWECVVAGTSGATEPTWVISDGSDTMDGNIHWRCRTIVTWKNIGNQAVFKEFGVISA